MDIRKKGTRAQPRIAAFLNGKEECFPAATILEWFTQALDLDDRKPSMQACEELARKLQVAINRASNREMMLAGEGELTKMRDIDGREWLSYKMEPLLDAAHKVIVAAREFEDVAGNYRWTLDSGETVDIEQVIDLMRKIGARPKVIAESMGRPREAWHSAARDVSRLLKETLRSHDFRGNLTATDEDSPIAVIGAQIINRAYRTRINSPGFASAIRSRRRLTSTKRDISFQNMFPMAARIKEA